VAATGNECQLHSNIQATSENRQKLQLKLERQACSEAGCQQNESKAAKVTSAHASATCALKRCKGPRKTKRFVLL